MSTQGNEHGTGGRSTLRKCKREIGNEGKILAELAQKSTSAEIRSTYIIKRGCKPQIFQDVSESSPVFTDPVSGRVRIVTWAAARRAIGTRKGEQET